MKHARALLLVLILLPVLAGAQEPTKEWTWTEKGGRSRSRAELDSILKAHDEWARSGGKLGQQAELVGADLRFASLNGVNLRGAILTEVILAHASLNNSDLRECNLVLSQLDGAFLIGAKLHGALLSGARIRDSNLSGADLSGTNLNVSSLEGSSLIGANLEFANLDAADLHKATLTEADLSNATLTRTSLLSAILDRANIAGAIFEPNRPPESRDFETARNLELVSYNSNPEALSILRQRFKESGLKTQERKLTYAIKRRETKLSAISGNYFPYAISTVLFDLTCQYGMNPTRPLWIAFALWLLSSFLFWAFLHTNQESGLIRISNERQQEGLLGNQSSRRIYLIPVGSIQGLARLKLLIRRESAAMGTAMFFSLMCVFNIGFRDLNFGRWLRLLTRQEFDIKAIGWARVVAGYESLFSVYLIALSVLSYFGRPFE